VKDKCELFFRKSKKCIGFNKADFNLKTFETLRLLEINRWSCDSFIASASYKNKTTLALRVLRIRLFAIVYISIEGFSIFLFSVSVKHLQTSRLVATSLVSCHCAFGCLLLHCFFLFVLFLVSYLNYS